MFKILIASATIFCLIRGYHSTTRDDFINQYQPILIEKSTNFTSEYLLANTQYTLIVDEIKNNTWTAVSVINTQITNLKTTIADAKKSAAKNPEALDCIKPQETAAGRLSSAPINSTCWVGVTYPEFVDARNAIQVLAKIPNATIPACTSLDPLPSQDQLFERCVTDKILDLDEELRTLKGDFERAKTDTIAKSVQCLADQSALIIEKVDEVDFQVRLCLALE